MCVHILVCVCVAVEKQAASANGGWSFPNKTLILWAGQTKQELRLSEAIKCYRTQRKFDGNQNLLLLALIAGRASYLCPSAESTHLCPSSHRSAAHTFISRVRNRICLRRPNFCPTAQRCFTRTHLFICRRLNRPRLALAHLFCRSKVTTPADYLILWL